MKLKKIYFDAFKSLLKKELEINDTCIGLVGINESGKSNLLYAINILKSDRTLTLADTPKMEDKIHDPALRFEFELNSQERITILNEIQNWTEVNTLIGRNIKKTNFNVTYHILFNKEKGVEERSFYLSGFELGKNYLILSKQYFNDLYKIKHEETFVPLNKAIVIKESDIKANEKHLKIYADLEAINEEIKNLSVDLDNLTNKTKVIDENIEDRTDEERSLIEEKIDKGKPLPGNINKQTQEIIHKQERLDEFRLRRNEYESQIEEYNTPRINDATIKEIEKDVLNISKHKENLATIKRKITEIKKLPALDDIQKKELTAETKKQSLSLSKIKALEENIKQKEKMLENLNKPLEEKYTSDIKEFNKYLGDVIYDTLYDFIPKVVFWEYSKDYILKSETLFDELLANDSLDTVSRPLVNVFGVGLEIKTIDDLHSRIVEFRNDANKRSKVEKKLNKEINNYIKSVWTEYDQEINITLEKDQIRIEIFDPKHNDASFYNMEDRSQGAQTFLSFLFTVGAEAKTGVISNTILLLDEPETHLHPSGVRFMLKELIKIAGRGNIVIYATHSIFMIDRENYNRHIILEKDREKTIIKPSSEDRIGFFMQEEVLYSTLDIDLTKELISTNRFNFVFEGNGDAVIFKHYYTEILKEHPFALDNTSYYHGGGCSNIEKYLKHRPIQLGTKWIFILDKDKPANKLKVFIEGKYKDYVGEDIYIFQYGNGEKKSSKIELEDILPVSIILDSYNKTAQLHQFEFVQKDLKKLVKKDKSFTEYNKEVLDTLYNGNSLESFKGKFKEVLNSGIKDILKENIDEDAFGKAFPDYFNWSNKMISSIKESRLKKER